MEEDDAFALLILLSVLAIIGHNTLGHELPLLGAALQPFSEAETDNCPKAETICSTQS